MYIVRIGLVCVILVTQVISGCPNGWETFDGSCYFIIGITEDWLAASDTCGLFHAHLAVVEDELENNFLKQIINKYHYGQINDRFYWLGATDVFVEGDWRWQSSGHRLNYTNWGPADPNNLHDQDCMLAEFTNTHFFWIDRGCSEKHSFVCEINDGSDAVIIG
ncbi:perlucin-like [Pecten maximus]|uniref:perlucin-like n=1 Tax=Pecten maximus TaxID=6579 RepID=UPI001458EC5C|nr:perlucin-like [Pecten maximus]